MTSKLIVNSLAADTGVSTITFADQAKMGNAIFHSTGFTIGDSFLHSTGVNITNINATGVITATKFVGEVSVGSSITFEDNEKAYFGTGTDFSIYHNGSASYLHEGGTGGLIVKTNTAFQVFNSAGSQPAFTVTPGGTVDLYHNNSKKFETSSLGITVNGAALVGGNIEINQDAYLKIGASNDLNFTHTGTDSYIQNVTGDLYIQSVGTNSDDIFIDAKDDISIRVQSTENAIKCIGNGAVELYHDNTKRFETTNTGVSVTGTGIFSGDVTVNGDELFIADSIKHVGDTDTSISFPSNDTIRFNTAGSERLRIDTNGRILIGHTINSSDFHGPQTTTNRNPFIQLHGANASSAGAALISWKNSAGAYYAPTFYLAHSGSDTKGTNGILPANGEFGSIVFSGDDGTDFVKGAMITAGLDGTPGTEDMPGRLEFYTTPDGAKIPVERLRITKDGNIEIGSSSGTGSDFSLLDGMVINTANGSAGLIINSSSSSHNAYMSFGYGSGSSTSHHDQFSAYIGRVGDDNLIFGTNNSIRASIDSSGVFNLNNIVQVGTTNDSGELRIGHDGSNYRARIVSNSSNRLTIDADGPERIQMHGGVIYIRPLNTELSAGFVANGAVELYYDNVKKFQTTSSGSQVLGTFSSVPQNNSQKGAYFGPYVIDNSQSAQTDDTVDIRSLKGVALDLTRYYTSGDIQTFRINNDYEGAIYVSPTGVQYNSTSDYRLKENVINLTGAIDRVKQLKPKRFNFIKDPGNTIDGFMAHEVSSVVPNAVIGEKDATMTTYYDEGDTIPDGKVIGDVKENAAIDPQSMDDSRLVPLLTAALQEAITEIEILKTKVSALEGS